MFVSKIEVLGVSIHDKLNFDDHVKRICSKASAQISALQRLTGLIDLPSRKAIYSSFIAAISITVHLSGFYQQKKVLLWLKKSKNGHSDLFSGTKCPAMMSFRKKKLVMNPSEFTP